MNEALFEILRDENKQFSFSISRINVEKDGEKEPFIVYSTWEGLSVGF